MGAFMLFVVVELELYVYVFMLTQTFLEYTVPSPKGGKLKKKHISFPLQTQREEAQIHIGLHTHAYL